MNCILNFLSDKHQKELRRLAQFQSESYEESLEKYKKLFIVHFLNVKGDCAREDTSSFCITCQEFRNIIDDIDCKEIEQFFDRLMNVYELWIDAKLDIALKNFNELLNEYKILDMVAEDIEKDIFFKVRVEKSILTKWEMLHIPFNKRYLIKNQRYSLTGQPMLYLGKSIVDVVEELEIQDETNLKISSFQIKESIRVYDLRNDIFKDITKKDVSVFLGTKVEGVYDKRKFFKNILASVCSFEKRREHKEYSFCEEYVMPQILAHIVKNEGYDGIIYYSTKRFKGTTFINEHEENISEETIDRSQKTQFKENLAIFTKFGKDHVYDHDLFEKLEISVPIDISKVENLTISDLEIIYQKIKNTGISEISTKSDLLISVFKREFDCIKINNEKYCNTYMGKLHIYHLYCILNQILCQSIKE